MVSCKICGKDFKPKHHLSVTCSESCKEENTRRIKRAYYERNRKEVIERSRNYRLANPEKQLESYHRNKHRYRENMLEYGRKYRVENKEKIQSYQREYEKRPERKRKMEEYRSDPDNKERSRESGRKYRKRNPRVCKNAHLKRKYGITIEDYDKMLEDQGGVCKICSNPETEVDKKKGKLKDLAVDHCHITGKVRGLLCGRCNKALGKFKDDPELIRSALNYLLETKE